MERVALRTRAVEELRCPSTVSEPVDKPVHHCDHFSIRGYVALLQKKDPKLYSLSQIFREEQQHDEHHSDLCPLSVAKFRRWSCPNCLDKMKNSDHRTTFRTLSTKQDGTNDGCSIALVRTIMPTRVDSRRLFSCTQQSSLGNNASASTFSKNAQECNSKCNSPSGSKGGLTEANVDPAAKELQELPNNIDISNDVPTDLPEPQMILNEVGNGTKELQEPPDDLDLMVNISNGVPDLPGVPQMISSKAGNGTKELQGSPDDLDVMANTLNDVSVDVTDVCDVPQMVSSKAGNGTQSPCSPKPCEVPNEDENERTQEILNGDCNDSYVPKPISGHKGPKPISGHKGSQVRNKCPRQAASKRNVGFNSNKKKKKPTDMADVSDHKLGSRKPKKMRRLSELIGADQVGGSASAIEVDHASTADLCESDKGKMSVEVGKDNETPVSNQKVEEVQSRTIENKTELKADMADDGSSLMNWLKKTHKKVRTEKKNSGHKNADSSVISHSTPDTPASEDMHHDFLPSVGALSQKEVLPTASTKHGNENTQNYNWDQNMQKADDLCQNEPGNSKKRFLSKGKSTILIKRKVPPTANVQHGSKSAGNSTIKRNMLKTDDLCQMTSGNTVQRCLTKVSLGKRDVSGLRDQKMSKNKKKPKLVMHEKQNLIDDIPMDIVELLARNQRERQMMTDIDPLENSHTRPNVTADDCAQIVAKDGSINASTVLDTNFQKSLASERKQKALQGHASSSTEAASVLPPDELHTQKSLQGHAASGTEAPDGHPLKLQMQKALQAHAASITEAFNVYPPKLYIPDLLKCTQEQQTHLSRDKEVTIACTSPVFSHQQHIAELPAQSWSNEGAKNLMWDSFKTGSRDSPTSTYGSQYRSIREVDSASTHVIGAPNNYPIHRPVIASVDHYKQVVSQVHPRGFPSTVSTMGADRLYDQRIAGQSSLYPNETMPATHLLRLMDSSTASGFTNYGTPNRNQMEFQSLGSPYVHNQYKASSSTSYGSPLNEKAPLTLQDLSRHQVQQNLHRPFRPHPRVGVLGSLLQQDIANWSENCGTQSGYRLGVTKGITSFDMNRKESFESLNSGMFSARWNALQLGSVSSAANPEYSLPRYGAAQSWTRGDGKAVHPLDKLVRKDICETNRNPADFTTISDNNEYMIDL